MPVSLFAGRGAEPCFPMETTALTEWKRTSGTATIAELAEREGIASSYVTRVLWLTLLAPDIIEAILDGKQGPEVTLAQRLEPFPLTWQHQEPNFFCRVKTANRRIDSKAGLS